MRPIFKNITPLLLFSAIFLLPSSVYAQGTDTQSLRLKTVVIDAGHGGKDAGAISKDRKTYEKNLTLSIAKSLGQKIEAEYPDVKVIYTRTTDKFVELNERAAIANRNKADLFISVHINSNNSASPSGFSCHILGQSSSPNRDLFSANQDLCRRENAVILLEDDYDTKYQGYNPSDPESFIFFSLVQNAHYEQSILFSSEVEHQLSSGPFKKNRGIAQNPFLVLWKTTMPAVLLELGFISNDDDLKVLNSTSGREAIAQKIFKAFCEFKKKYDGSVDYAHGDAAQVKPAGTRTSGSSSVGTETSQSPASIVDSSSYDSNLASVSSSTDAVGDSDQAAQGKYGVQIFTLSRKLNSNDKALKGHSVTIYQSGKQYRYITEICPSEEEARARLASVKKDFPDAYVVNLEDY